MNNKEIKIFVKCDDIWKLQRDNDDERQENICPQFNIREIYKEDISNLPESFVLDSGTNAAAVCALLYEMIHSNRLEYKGYEMTDDDMRIQKIKDDLYYSIMPWNKDLYPVSEEDKKYCDEHWEEYQERKYIHINDPVNYDVSVEGVFNRLIMRMKEEIFFVSGGLFFSDDDKRIYPGCCSGFNRWHEIKKSLRNKKPIFMGHDPYVSFGEKEGVCYISTAYIGSYGGVKTENGKRIGRYRVTRTIEEALANERATTIGFLPDEWIYCLDRLDDDFMGFVDGPLRKKIKEIIPEREEDFLEAFNQCFMYGNNSEN